MNKEIYLQVLIKVFITLLLSTNILLADTSTKKSTSWDMHNIWIKTYINNKNYTTIINNITIIEQKLQRKNNSLNKISKLQKKLNLYQSKLKLYQKDNSFDLILKRFKYTVREITMFDYIFKDSLAELDKLTQKYRVLEKDFYLAKSKIQSLYTVELKKNKHSSSAMALKEDLDYFIEYSENIEKIDHNLLETKEEILQKYQEYRDEVLIKHIFTITVILLAYILYKILYAFINYLSRKGTHYDEYKNYTKVLSTLFVIFIIIFLMIRYIDDLLYIVTFLSVIAAALTLASREIIISVAGGVYLFFSHMIRVGDRIMVQFGNRHTIGDVIDVTLFQIKLTELEDYNNLKDVKNMGRTVYIPNSYLFSHVFYNYSLKKHGMIRDLIELEFSPQSDFDKIEKITKVIFDDIGVEHTISFTLNALKTGIIAKISYQTNYKDASKNGGKIMIRLLKELSNYDDIMIKQAR